MIFAENSPVDFCVITMPFELFYCLKWGEGRSAFAPFEKSKSQKSKIFAKHV
jgi:hypothetical protein